MNCHYCGEPVDPASRATWWRVVGWERKATTPGRRHGSDIAVRERRPEYAHDKCVRRAQAGLAPTQQQLV